MSRSSELTLGQLINHYMRSKFRRSARKEAQAYRSLRPHFDVAILNAVKISPVDGRKHRHQWRLPEHVLSVAQSKLLDASKEIRAARDFESLHVIVKEEIGQIDGVGPLAVYDIAHQLGAFLGKEPKLVYLHSGSAEGAALLGFTGDTVDKKELPEVFSPLTCAEIEDFLCIYKKQLAGKSLAELTSMCFIPEEDG